MTKLRMTREQFHQLPDNRKLLRDDGWWMTVLDEETGATVLAQVEFTDPKRETRNQRTDRLFKRLHALYNGPGGPSDEVKRLYWLLADRAGTNPRSHAELDQIERDLIVATRDLA